MDRFDSERSDPHDTTDLKTLDRAELDADSSVLSTSRSHETTDEVAAGKLRTLKDIPDRRNSLSFSYSDEEDDTDLFPTLTTEKLCSKNSVLPNSASAEGDIGEFAARIAEAKVKKDNMKFSFPEPEFLKEIPKYDRDYEDHELEDASDLIPLLLSTQKIKVSGVEDSATMKFAKLTLNGHKE
ncbi:uncharacterized protein LOC111247769 isoform X1 [Varroa destructor]|uniref:Uncharacterized protein n=1 Tax=Varroa destructor TaxID=109461 RepID=A0A7M7K2Y5_VARDE|nr:uncharacterized protein LOC111247769 isoform X1 [Varroa destructor]XP_022654827.1 uncharacterized protein LOC111247769 isoform X1 [Varroa destructor]